jgi:glycerophosphoryl diester phosphodiesterase
MKYLFLILFPLAVGAQILPAVKNKCVVIAHRGNHTHAPENTLKSIRDAIDVGADYVEIDLRSTQDGQMILMHDETVDRMTNVKGKVKELTWTSLRKAQVSDKANTDFGTYPIPTFIEALNLCKGKIHVYLDFKDADVRIAWELIKSAGMEKSFVVYINSELQYKSWRSIAPAVPLMVSLPDSVKNENQLSAFTKKVDAEILDGSYTDYTSAMVHEARLQNRAVWVDVQSKNENANTWRAALDLKLQGLQTDHPKELIGFLVSQGLR